MSPELAALIVHDVEETFCPCGVSNDEVHVCSVQTGLYAEDHEYDRGES